MEKNNLINSFQTTPINRSHTNPKAHNLILTNKLPYNHYPINQTQINCLKKALPSKLLSRL